MKGLSAGGSFFHTGVLRETQQQKQLQDAPS